MSKIPVEMNWEPSTKNARTLHYSVENLHLPNPILNGFFVSRELRNTALKYLLAQSSGFCFLNYGWLYLGVTTVHTLRKEVELGIEASNPPGMHLNCSVEGTSPLYNLCNCHPSQLLQLEAWLIRSTCVAPVH